MRKKTIIVSHLRNRLPISPVKRIQLSRETLRTLSAKELSQAAGGLVDDPCQNGSTQDI